MTINNIVKDTYQLFQKVQLNLIQPETANKILSDYILHYLKEVIEGSKKYYLSNIEYLQEERDRQIINYTKNLNMKDTAVKPSEVSQKINFSTNWNKKLYTDIFTTIRLSKNKYRIGRHYKVFLKNTYFGIVQIKEVKIFRATKLPNITAQLDTGYSKDETLGIIKRMYRLSEREMETKELVLVVCKWVYREKVAKPWK